MTIPSGGSATIAGNLTGSGAFSLASGATGSWAGGSMSGTGITTVASGATLSLSSGGTLARALVNNGTVNWSSGTLNAQPSASWQNAGALNLKPDSSFAGNWPTLWDRGSGTFAFTIASTGTITLDGGSGGYGSELDGLSSSAGKINLKAGTLTLKPPAGVTASLTGGATVAAGTTLELEGAASGSSTGGFLLPAAGTPTPTLSGAGTLMVGNNPGVPVELAGATSIANINNADSGGNAINIDTNNLQLTSYTQAPGTALGIALASATSYGSITTAQKATIDGTLNITLAGTYQPPLGTQFAVLQATGGLTGTFATINSPSAAPFKSTYTATTATLTRSTSATSSADATRNRALQPKSSRRRVTPELGGRTALRPPAVARPQLSAATTAVQTVHTAWGTIGYRALGHGRPLVLVIGQSDSIDGWPPSFIDALARRHQVFAIDNEGVGRSTLRPGRLTISRMADDAAAFIAALRLKRPDALGWRMGAQIVEALAIRHPTSVRRIILAATGTDYRGAQPTTSPTPNGPTASLFPPGQQTIKLAYTRDLRLYPHSYTAPPFRRPATGERDRPLVARPRS